MNVGGKGYDPIRHPFFLKNKLCRFLVMTKKGWEGNLTGAATKKKKKKFLKAINRCIFNLLIDEDKSCSKLHPACGYTIQIGYGVQVCTSKATPKYATLAYRLF